MSVIKEFNESTGYFTPDLYHDYDVYDVSGLLSELDDEYFLDFLDVYIHVIHSNCDFKNYMKNYCDYDKSIDNLNNIMKMNGVDLKIEDGYCTRIFEPTIQEEVITPAFIELKEKNFTRAQEELRKSFDFFKKGTMKELLVLPIWH